MSIISTNQFEINNKLPIPTNNPLLLSSAQGKVDELAQATIPAIRPKIQVTDQNSLMQISNELSLLTLDNLSMEAKQEVKNLLCRFGHLVEKYDLTEIDLDFLLKATPDARSLLVPKWTENSDERLQKIAEFRQVLLNAKDGKYPLNFESKARILAEDLESFATAIGYSGLDPHSPTLGPFWVKKEGVASENLRSFIQAFGEGNYITCAIGETDKSAHAFPSRSQENIQDHHLKEVLSKDAEILKHSIGKQIDQDAKLVFVGSHNQASIDDLSISKPGLDPRSFSTESYVSRAIESGVAMRAHVSGSAPLTLAALNFFDRENNHNTTEDQLFIRAGIIISTYQLGDYHTIAETAAGISHYHQQREHQQIYSAEDLEGNLTTENLEQVSPITFLSVGIGHMNKVIDLPKVEEFTKTSQRLLDCVSSQLAKKTFSSSPCNSSPKEPSDLYQFFNMAPFIQSILQRCIG